MDEQKLYKIADELTINDIMVILDRFMAKDSDKKIRSLHHYTDGTTVKIKVKREVINHGK